MLCHTLRSMSIIKCEWKENRTKYWGYLCSLCWCFSCWSRDSRSRIRSGAPGGCCFDCVSCPPPRWFSHPRWRAILILCIILAGEAGLCGLWGQHLGLFGSFWTVSVLAKVAVIVGAAVALDRIRRKPSWLCLRSTATQCGCMSCRPPPTQRSRLGPPYHFYEHSGWSPWITKPQVVVVFYCLK